MSEEPVKWLNEVETETWLNIWSLYVWLPSRLDAQLKENIGISHYEYFALAQISMAPEQKLRMSELAALSDMTLSHLSRVVTRLEKQGWVTRLPDPDDGRSTLAALTEEGWELVRRAAPGHVNEVRKLVFDNLEQKEIEQLSAIMPKIVDSLNPPRKPRA
ncbi:MarR family winged helix-turn-helix transcriptional regulator [Corynebacterium halotolerans]|uniref:MarR family winged helix-turn-helix transcriptional regulator n=1 Tax=Corynebacterium halotolerans TaxID=225326 RepID=UPI003CE9CDA9